MKETEAARAVLLEVLNALGAMRDDLIIVGGWVPDLLYPSSNHMGSLDVDLAVSPKALQTFTRRLGKKGSWSFAGGHWQGSIGTAAGQVPHI